MAQENSLIYQMRISMALKQRKICLYDNVECDSIFECVYFLHRLIDIDLKVGKKEPIELLINTNGGSLEECLSLLSLIEQMKDDGYTIITTNTGKAYSAGFVLAISGTIRKSYRHARYMYHSLSAGSGGKLQTMIDDIEEFKIYQNKMVDIVSKYTAISPEKLRLYDKQKEDKYFSPVEMVELKGIDIIL